MKLIFIFDLINKIAGLDICFAVKEKGHVLMF